MNVAAQQIDRQGYLAITDLDTLSRFVKDAWNTGVLCWDTETTGLNIVSDELVGIALATRPGHAAYVPLGHDAGDQLPLSDVIKVLEPVLMDPLVIKVTHNGKFDLSVVWKYGITVNGVEDTMLMAYSMYGGRHRMNMDELSARFLKHPTIKFSQVAGNGTFNQVPIPLATAYAAEDADVTLRLAQVFSRELEADDAGLRVYRDLEMPLIPVIAKMERAGIKADLGHLAKLSTEFGAEMDRQLDAMIQIAGDFNPGSPQQVGAKLEQLGVVIKAKTESGQLATGVKVLEDLLEHEQPEAGEKLIGMILEWRKFAKLKGTYTDALAEQVNPTTGRVHPSFGMASTQTGRLACSDPNLQNIPIRTDEGKQLRAAFIAEPGHKLISADYSQIELRIAAHASGDEAMFRAFETGVDIHQATASDVLGIPLDQVTPDQRRWAKAINFGIIYGKTAYGLSRDLKITKREAEDFIGKYLDAFSGIRDYMERAKAFAHKHEYVQTIYGRKIWLPGIRSNHSGLLFHTERAAVNAPIQGTAADIIKKAMILVDKALANNGLETRLLLQVHDELVFEAPNAEIDAARALIKTTMETAVDYLDVPLVVEVGVGDNWLEAH